MEVARTDHMVTSQARSDFTSNHTSPLEKVLAMGKGDGADSSYCKNSMLQACLNQVSMNDLTNALEKVALPSGDGGGGPVVVADMGSSSGPNCIGHVAFIVDKLRQRLHKDAEVQAYFNDLPSNDFNNLFQLLRSDSRADHFFAAGIPGSYFKRLLAHSSVHVFYSCLSLHWLSKLPDSVLDKDSPAYNRGSQWFMHSRSAVAKAYQQQAALDLKSFLLARGAELVSGGLLFLIFSGRHTSEPNEPTLDNSYKFQLDMDGIWSDLVAEGVLSEQQRDTFNVPYYLRNIEDVREAIASCDSLFHVLITKLQKFEHTAPKLFATSASESVDLSKKMVGQSKAWLNPLLEAQLGKKVSAVIWQRYEKLVEKRIRTSPEDLGFKLQTCVVGLIRK